MIGPALPLLGIGILAVTPNVAEAAQRHDAQAIWVRGENAKQELAIESVAVGDAPELAHLGFRVIDQTTGKIEQQDMATVSLSPMEKVPVSHVLTALPHPGSKIIEGLALDPTSGNPHPAIKFAAPLRVYVAEADEVKFDEK